jgi:hypothetical protein
MTMSENEERKEVSYQRRTPFSKEVGEMLANIYPGRTGAIRDLPGLRMKKKAKPIIKEDQEIGQLPFIGFFDYGLTEVSRRLIAVLKEYLEARQKQETPEGSEHLAQAEAGVDSDEQPGELMSSQELDRLVIQEQSDL